MEVSIECQLFSLGPWKAKGLLTKSMGILKIPMSFDLVYTGNEDCINSLLEPISASHRVCQPLIHTNHCDDVIKEKTATYKASKGGGGKNGCAEKDRDGR